VSTAKKISKIEDSRSKTLSSTKLFQIKNFFFAEYKENFFSFLNTFLENKKVCKLIDLERKNKESTKLF